MRVENDTLIYQGSAAARDYIIFDGGQKPYRWELIGSTVEPGPGCERHTSPTTFVSCPATHNADIHLGDHGGNRCLCGSGPEWTVDRVRVFGGAARDASS